MKHREFKAHLDDAKIVAAIAQAEASTSGEIRVVISTHKCPDPMAAAHRQFHRLGMTKTAHRNAVLFFIAPKSQTFAIYGDTGVHAKCGETFWSALRDEMTDHLKAARYTEALVLGITQAGRLLADHFPPTPSNPNELPNKIERD